MMKGPVRELIAVGSQQVRLRLPQGAQAKRLKLLVAGTEPKYRESGGVLEVTVPTLLAHEVIAIDV